MGRDEKLSIVRRDGERSLVIRHDFTDSATFSLIKLPLVPLLSFGTWHLWATDTARELAAAGLGPGLPGGSPDCVARSASLRFGRYPVTPEWFAGFDLGWIHGGGYAALVRGDCELESAALESLMDVHLLPSEVPAAIVFDNDFDLAWVMWSADLDQQFEGIARWTNPEG